MEKQYIVLEYRSGFHSKEWEVVRESKRGVTLKEAQEIQQFKIKYTKVSIENLRIVKVFDAGMPEIV